MHIDILCLDKVISRKTDIFCVAFKMKKVGAEKGFSRDIFYIFFPHATFSTKLGMRTYEVDIYAQIFCLGFSDIYFFPVTGTYVSK